ncbi:polyphosphate kinase 2 family protein, partial [Streptomyces mirabilis]
MAKKDGEGPNDGEQGKGGAPSPLRRLLRVPGGQDVDLSLYDARATPAGPRDKAAGLAALAQMVERLADLQERLWAASTAGDRRRVLLILQGMDT